MRWLAPSLGVLLCTAGLLAQNRPAQNAAAEAARSHLVESLAVDASEAPRKVFHARLTIHATPGDFVLIYPKWIPGEHGPSGPVVQTAGIYFRAKGADLRWRRDPLDMYAFHVQVPDGVSSIEVALDYLAPVEMPGGFTAGSSATDKLAVLSWNWFLLYPKGIAPEAIAVNASLKLPQGWQWASALPRGAEAGVGRFVDFAPASLRTVLDSPVLMGEYMKKIALRPEGRAVDGRKGELPAEELDMAADSDSALEIKPEQIEAYKNLVAEAGALFGATHYRDYHFLLTLSDHVAHFGLEHHECNDSRLSESFITDDTQWLLSATLLPHEYVHSWNGKYRRPAGLATADYDTPADTRLLWVYEGLTQYFGWVLTARSGLETPEQWREALARTAMTYSYRPGRNWRSLEDTATAAQLLYGAPAAFSSYRRGVDYYDEGALIWLEADTMIRRKSAGRRSLDDFARLFFGGHDSGPEVKTYTLDDLLDALNQVQPYGWRGFFDERVRKLDEHAPLQGILNSGWRLVYNNQPNLISQQREQAGGAYDATASVGLVVNKDGAVADVIEGSVAAKKGIAPGMKVIAVNERKFTPELLPRALRRAHRTGTPIRLLVENNDYIHSITLDYFDGLRYPHLVREANTPDLLNQIIHPKITTLPKPFVSED